MHRYYVNTNPQPDGEHEVHREGCPTPAAPENRYQLGHHSHCQAAMVQARKIYPTADGCANCCPECHRV